MSPLERKNMIVQELELPDEIEALKALLLDRQALLAQRDLWLAERDARILELEHQNRILAKIAFSPRSERRPSKDFDRNLHQGWLLFPELVEAAERVADQTGQRGEIEIRSTGSERRAKRRKQFPPHLPLFRTTYELPESERRCACGAELKEIGQEESRELERLEITAIHEIARKKYACKTCQEGVKTAPGPDRVIEKGLLGAGFLAHLLTERFGNHMPYNRLEKKYQSEGLDLSRAVLCRSAIRCAQLLEPLVVQMKKELLAGDIVQTDDTPVTLQESSEGVRRQARLWVYRGREGEQVFDFTESRKRDGPLKFLGDYRGYLQADAYGGYDALFHPEGAKEVACWAHARRKFVDSEPSDPSLAKEAIGRIAELYAIERRAKEEKLGPEKTRSLRQEESLPRLKALRDWLLVSRTKVLEKSPMAQAIDYALNQWEALCRYGEDGRLSIDNNASERSLRAVAVGRKNWLFFGNENGGRAAAILYSLVSTCKEIGIDPRSYLRDVLLRIARERDVTTLTPRGWKKRWAQVVQDHRLSILERFSQIQSQIG
jgi:transposase